MGSKVELKNLQQHIRNLAILEETASPAINCYLNLEVGLAGYRNAFDERVRILRKSLVGEALAEFAAALSRIKEFIRTGLAASTRGGSDQYKVEPTEIVQPTATHVLANSARSTLTLVTCYPFYFVGHAPKRFIVEAALSEGTRLQKRTANHRQKGETNA